MKQDRLAGKGALLDPVVLMGSVPTSPSPHCSDTHSLSSKSTLISSPFCSYRCYKVGVKTLNQLWGLFSSCNKKMQKAPMSSGLCTRGCTRTFRDAILQHLAVAT